MSPCTLSPAKGNDISPQPLKNAVEFNEVNPTALGDAKKHGARYKSNRLLIQSTAEKKTNPKTELFLVHVR